MTFWSLVGLMMLLAVAFCVGSIILNLGLYLIVATVTLVWFTIEFVWNGIVSLWSGNAKA